MRAPVSVIIPTLNAAAVLPETLAHLAEGLGAGVIRELVITDGGSDDDIAALAQEAGAIFVEGPPGRGGQLGRGVAAAEGSWLLVLHADTHLAPGWSEAVLDHLRDHPDKAGYFRLAFRASGPAPAVFAGWANLRSRWGLPYGDQGLLIRRDLYDAAGGYPDIPLMEDVALARALRGRLTKIGSTAHTSAARYRAQGWLNRGSRNLLTLSRYLLGADPERLARAYSR